jgi:hypothetical protein
MFVIQLILQKSLGIYAPLMTRMHLIGYPAHLKFVQKKTPACSSFITSSLQS